jgi:dihydroorotate dehydrogenase (fumarate)
MDGTQGYAAVDETRGLLAIPIGADEDARERGDYVSALRRANGVDFGPW